MTPGEIIAWKKNNPGSVILGLAGDTMLGRLVNSKISKTNYSYPWGNVLPLLHSTDLNVVNLETTFTTSVIEVPKVFNFKADPDKVESLKQAHIHAVCLANNHILDYSVEGMLETIHVLDNAGIKRTGAGRNSKEAEKPIVITVNNATIGIIGCTDNEPEWKAGNFPGTNYIEIGDLNAIGKLIGDLKKQVDVLIVSIHWGPNMLERPNNKFVSFAHSMIDMGADIIHGHSAHIFQGIEVYNNGLVLYDTGDFIDDYAVDRDLRNDRSFFFLCEVNKQGVVSLKLVPVLIGEMQVNLAHDHDYDWCITRIQMLSAEFGTYITDRGELFMRHEHIKAG